jgi:hypothetical protein
MYINYARCEDIGSETDVIYFLAEMGKIMFGQDRFEYQDGNHTPC